MRRNGEHADGGGRGAARRTLLGASLAHGLHDGLTDLVYVLLPVWQARFGLSYAALALLRASYYGTMGGLQLPADRWTRPVDGRRALAAATAVAGGGFLLMGVPVHGQRAALVTLCAGLVVAGIGSSVQHPRASALLADVFGAEARRPLGTYNFAGDLGKAAFPPAVALLLTVAGWRGAVAIVGGVALAGALGVLLLLPSGEAVPGGNGRRAAGPAGGGRFGTLLALGALDTATRMGFLLFLPFLLRDAGGGKAATGLGFAALFAGGAFGKAVCGRLGERFGFAPSVVGTELATAALIGAASALPLVPALAVLPVLGVVLNGTSSVLYGTVPELAPGGDVGRGFALFYTAVIGAGALAPIGFGMVGDRFGAVPGVAAAASCALLTVPLALAVIPAGGAGGRAASAR